MREACMKGVRREGWGNSGRESHPSLGPAAPDDLSALASNAPVTMARADTFPSLYLQISSPDSFDGWSLLIILMWVPA